MISNTTPREVTLPSGIFVKIRPGNFLDLGIALGKSAVMGKDFAEMGVRDKDDDLKYAAGSIQVLTACLAARLCTFDDARWTADKILQLDIRDAMALSALIDQYIDRTKPLI
jgi:hypothetical protein